jgi:CHASE3 domain sensor protein/PAS domain-containing protein
MKEYIKKLIQRRGLRLSLLLIITIICLNAVLVIYYRNVINNNAKLADEIQLVKDGISANERNLHMADMGVRAYIIKQTDALIDPFITAKNDYSKNLDSLRQRLGKMGYDTNKMAVAITTIAEYIQTCQLMVDLCNEGKINEAIEIFEEDRGFDAWVRYAPFIEDSNAYIGELSEKSHSEYQNSLNLILIVQILLLLLVVPILIVVYRKTIRDDKFKFNVFRRIDKSNKTYLYDQGEETEEGNEDSIIENIEINLKKAANFISNISKGKYDIEWEGMDENVATLNKKNIAGELIQMREQMLKGKKTDEIRLWTNEGLSNFAEIVRNHQNNLDQLSEELISNMVIYLNAHQGGLFFLNDDNDEDKFLELMGCYAYQRKKFLDKRIEIGQSMVGQCFLEGETNHITNIPEEYVNITSGLGNTNPTTLLIVPLKINEEVLGVVEIASLKPFEKHQIQFLERIAEIIASSIMTVRRNDKNKILLEQSQQQSEEMRAQEEEMRQNMEELQATQEQIHRKNEEVESLLEQASANEESMKMKLEESHQQAEEMRAQEEEMRQNMEELQATQEEMDRKNKEVEKLLEQASANEESMKAQQMLFLEEQEALELEDAILSTLMEVIPDRVTVKDQEGKYLKVSQSKNLSLKEQGFTDVIGKSDKEMFGRSHFEKSFSAEKKIMTTQKSVLNIEEKIELSKEKSIWGSTSRVPLKDKVGAILGTIVVTRDITKEKLITEELNKLKKNS